ncbi:ribosomal large subunit pseudouridine synthase A [Nitzschia inconspicua]|uniref:Ribosomal large subunit pseudouridine synthase A n=1 Tax=Nitzschia inconspicua TaxID=303405 RepID=A0A9K3PD62_9STRA|nr:ribosomal large subunit pseudouridine synthase A [Nitzschia inconspicua]
MFSTILPPPNILFSNHHILVVHKPAGWRSIPLDANDPAEWSARNYNNNNDNKCLLSYLRNQRLGGGSQQDYLKPVHRLDQPCTGLLVFAKNTKAASRIQRAWADRLVQKEYYCVVQHDDNTIEQLRQNAWKRQEVQKWIPSSSLILPDTKRTHKNNTVPWGGDRGWNDPNKVFVLGGLLRKSQHGRGSVHVTPLRGDWKRYFERKQKAYHQSTKKGNHKKKDQNNQTKTTRNDGTFCCLEFRFLGAISKHGLEQNPTNKPETVSTRKVLDGRKKETIHSSGRTEQSFQLLAIRTNMGLRHQIRAMLASIGGCPILGDLRYGNNHNNNHQTDPLPDQSVALHARTIYMPTVQLGGTDLTSQPFVAPIPTTWNDFFALTEEQLRKKR